ncbi:hypothetical protein DH2020_041169 [Rehmannia glutinosa]|uniref:Thioredoxin domain-containing protein n=1 Tax=Rehmannia glutinosa TaxID=99300 RepID=A0ABR0UR06_REHGL
MQGKFIDPQNSIDLSRISSASNRVHATAAEADQPKWWEKGAGPNMIDIHSTQEFVDALSQAGDRLVIVEFFGAWCASCRALFPKVSVPYRSVIRVTIVEFEYCMALDLIYLDILTGTSISGVEIATLAIFDQFTPSLSKHYGIVHEIAEQHQEILFLKVNFDENKPLCRSLNIKVLPYFHFYRGADGLLDSFSCSLAKLQKLKDAIASHNKASHNDSLLNHNGGASDFPELSASPEDKPL